MDVDGNHRAFDCGNNGQLGVWCDVADGVDTLYLTPAKVSERDLPQQQQGCLVRLALADVIGNLRRARGLRPRRSRIQ